jgi:capping protein alpha
MSTDPRIATASSFLLQSPPGEINDVLNGSMITNRGMSKVHWLLLNVDVRAIVSDDEALQDGLIPALEQYNMEQFITVPVPGQPHQVCRFCLRILCNASYYRVLHGR